MHVPLNEAIEIYAKALRYKYGYRASYEAREKARQLAASGDHEGYTVWIKIAEIAEALSTRKAKH